MLVRVLFGETGPDLHTTGKLASIKAWTPFGYELNVHPKSICFLYGCLKSMTMFVF